MALAYHWKATYNDDSILNQFDGESENLFGDIDMGELKKFELLGQDEQSVDFEVNFSTDKILADGSEEFTGCSGDLVFFRRNRIIASGFENPSRPYVEFHLGRGSDKLIVKIDGAYSQV